MIIINNENIQKLLDKAIVKFLCNLYLMEWPNFGDKYVKKIQIQRSRFDYESESEYYSSCKNHEYESEFLGFRGKDSNPNPNICDNTGES